MPGSVQQVDARDAKRQCIQDGLQRQIEGGVQVQGPGGNGCDLVQRREIARPFGNALLQRASVPLDLFKEPYLLDCSRQAVSGFASEPQVLGRKATGALRPDGQDTNQSVLSHQRRSGNGTDPLGLEQLDPW